MAHSDPTQSAGLELDPGQPGLHLSHDRDAIPETLYTGMIRDNKPEQYSYTPSKQKEYHLKLPKSTFWLSIALVVALAAAIIAAAVSGSLAVQRQHRMNQMCVFSHSNDSQDQRNTNLKSPDSLPVMVISRAIAPVLHRKSAKPSILRLRLQRLIPKRPLPAHLQPTAPLSQAPILPAM